jgi:hypothetical protein
MDRESMGKVIHGMLKCGGGIATSHEADATTTTTTNDREREEETASADADRMVSEMEAIAQDALRQADDRSASALVSDGLEAMYGGPPLPAASADEANRASEREPHRRRRSSAVGAQEAAAAAAPPGDPRQAVVSEWVRAEDEARRRQRAERRVYPAGDYSFERMAMMMTGWGDSEHQSDHEVNDIPAGRWVPPLTSGTEDGGMMMPTMTTTTASDADAWLAVASRHRPDPHCMDDLFEMGERIDAALDAAMANFRDVGVGDAMPDLGAEGCSKAYCRDFLREPVREDPMERRCRAGPNCVAKRMSTVRPGHLRGAKREAADGFVCREFLRPDQLARARATRALPPEAAYCLLCVRFKHTRLFFKWRRLGAVPTTVFQNHWNTYVATTGDDPATADEYTELDILHNSENKTDAMTGVVKPLVMFRTSRYFPAKTSVPYTDLETGEAVFFEVRCFEERRRDFA